MPSSSWASLLVGLMTLAVVGCGSRGSLGGADGPSTGGCSGDRVCTADGGGSIPCDCGTERDGGQGDGGEADGPADGPGQEDGGDLQGPVIAHVVIANGRPAGSSVTVTASASDYSGIAAVTCYYRGRGATSWIPMSLALQSGSKYGGTFPAQAVAPPAVEYYLEATDASPRQNRSFLPINAPDAFFTFTVTP